MHTTNDDIKAEGYRFSLFSDVEESCFFKAELKIHCCYYYYYYYYHYYYYYYS